MRRREIVREIDKRINIGKSCTNKVTLKEITQVIEAFKDILVECIEDNEEFVYWGFLEKRQSVRIPNYNKKKGKATLVDPRTQKKHELAPRYRVSIALGTAIKDHIRTIKVNKADLRKAIEEMEKEKAMEEEQ